MFTMSKLSNNSAFPKLIRGIALRVVSGDEVVIIRDNQETGLKKRLEKKINLAGIVAPKIGKRLHNGKEIKDEPYAFEAREFLRKKIVGKMVTFQIMHKVPASKREYGVLYLGKDTSGENLNHLLLSKGMAGVQLNKRCSLEYKRLLDIETTAKSSGYGIWSNDALSSHVRDIQWSIDDPQAFLEEMRGRRISAVIEFVRNGSTMRALLLPQYYNIELLLSGAQSPEIKLEAEGKPDKIEPFAEDAKLFLESRILQQDVEIILESRNNRSFVGSVLHPNGNIAELLLSKGLARCVDWSLQTVTGGPERLRAAERQAKQKQIGIWKNSVPIPPTLTGPAKIFSGKVLETVNGNAIVVKHPDGSERKIYLASVRPPKPVEGKKAIRPLFEIPWMYEAREFLRNKLNQKQVDVIVDYIIPKTNEFQEKVFATVMMENVNVAEELIAEGLATVVQHRNNDNQRSSAYDRLLTAEMKAIKSCNGIHSKMDPPMKKVNDLIRKPTKAKEFFPSLKRAGRTQAVVEFVASGSRLGLYLPKENCKINFSLSSILIPNPHSTFSFAEHITAYVNTAYQFTKDFCHQKNVQIEVESIDKKGNFLGWLWEDSKNLSLELVQKGLGKIHPLAEESYYLNKLRVAEKDAQERRANIWSIDGQMISEAKEENLKQTKDSEEKKPYQNVLITYVNPDLGFFVQTHEEGPSLLALMNKFRKEYESSPPLAGAYKPKKGDICAVKFIDGCWYRALVENVTEEQVHVFYLDYGNREVTAPLRCASLIEAYQTPHPFAKEYRLAFVSLPNDENDTKHAIKVFNEITHGLSLLLSPKYKHEEIEHVTLYDTKEKQDIGRILVEGGFLKVEPNLTIKQQEHTFKDYLVVQDFAKKQRSNIWRHGDITEDY